MTLHAQNYGSSASGAHERERERERERLMVRGKEIGLIMLREMYCFE